MKKIHRIEILGLDNDVVEIVFEKECCEQLYHQYFSYIEFKLFVFAEIVLLKTSLAVSYFDKLYDSKEFDSIRVSTGNELYRFLELTKPQDILSKLERMKDIACGFNFPIEAVLFEDVKKLCEASIELEKKTGND